MSPNADDGPARRPQTTEVSKIAGTIRMEFFTPERTQFMLPCRQSPSMPEIAVNEKSNFFASEHDVWTTRERTNVSAESQTAARQFLLYYFFNRTIFQLHSLHCE